MVEAGAPTREDISYVRTLAESGAHAPLLGGRFMLWWGLLVTGAYILHHFALQGAFGSGGAVFLILWLGFAILGVAGQAVLARSMPAKPGAGSAGNRASRTVWIAAGCAIAAMSLGTAAAAESGAGAAAFDWIVPLAFAVYACALVVTGSLARSRVTIAAGIGAIVMVGLFTALILSEERYLVAALGAFLTVLLPGLMLARVDGKSPVEHDAISSSV